MGGFDSDKIRKLAIIPEDFDIMACIAIGKALDEDKLNDEQKEREMTPRKRRPLNEIYSINEWK